MAAMFKLKGKTPGWSGLVVWWLCAHRSLHHVALSSAKSRIYMPPPSSRTQWRGDLAAVCASPAVCCLRGQLRPARGRRDAAAWPPPCHQGKPQLPLPSPTALFPAIKALLCAPGFSCQGL